MDNVLEVLRIFQGSWQLTAILGGLFAAVAIVGIRKSFERTRAAEAKARIETAQIQSTTTIEVERNKMLGGPKVINQDQGRRSLTRDGD